MAHGNTAQGTARLSTGWQQTLQSPTGTQAVRHALSPPRHQLAKGLIPSLNPQSLIPLQLAEFTCRLSAAAASGAVSSPSASSSTATRLLMCVGSGALADRRRARQHKPCLGKPAFALCCLLAAAVLHEIACSVQT